MIMEALKKKHPDFTINMHDPPSDGNCFFSAAALAIFDATGIKKDQSQIRYEVCSTLESEFGDEIQNYWLNDFQIVSGSPNLTP